MGERVGNLQKGSENRSHHRPFRINKPNSSVSRVSVVDKILHLQRTIGNRALTRLIQSGALQARLTVGPPNDIYEKEADRVADRVMRMAAPEAGCPECTEEESVRRQEEKEEEIQTSPLSGQITPLVQREEVESEEEEPLQTKLIQQQAAEEEEEPVKTRPIQRQVDFEEKEEIQTKLQRQAEEEEEPVQAKAAAGRTTAVSSGLESGIRSLKGGGQTLPRASRDFFEPRFGADFSRVRIHTGSSAARIARSINARAFTTGRDVVFGAGQYSPQTSSGQKLLAHELTHVIQQKKIAASPRTAKSTLQRWRLGRSDEALPHPNYQVVPDEHQDTVNDARDLVKKVVDNSKKYPGCRRYFENECGAGLNPDALQDAYDNAVIWYSTMNGTSFGGSMPGTHHMRYSPLAYRLGKWAIASTMVHEMFHRCDLAVIDREIRAIEAEEKCRFYIPFIFSLSPGEGAEGDVITIRGTNFGSRQGRYDKVEFNGVDAGRVESWGMYRIRVKVPAGARTGSVVVTNNRVKSNQVRFVVK